MEDGIGEESTLWTHQGNYHPSLRFSPENGITAISILCLHLNHVVADRGHAVADRTIRTVREGRNAPKLPF